MNEPLTQETTLLYGVYATNEFTVFRHGLEIEQYIENDINPKFHLEKTGRSPMDRSYKDGSENR